MISKSFDIIIIGGGIIGLATAMTLSKRFPRLTISVLDKEKEISEIQGVSFDITTMNRSIKKTNDELKTVEFY